MKCTQQVSENGHFLMTGLLYLGVFYIFFDVWGHLHYLMGCSAPREHVAQSLSQVVKAASRWNILGLSVASPGTDRTDVQSEPRP